MTTRKIPPQKELDLLHRIVHIMSSTIEIKPLLQQIAEMLVDLTKCDSGLIYIYDEKNKELILLGAHNAHKNVLGNIKLKLGEGITGWVAQHKKPLAIADKAYADPRFKFFAALPEDKFESILSVPILLKNQLTGVINLSHRKAHKFNVREIELVNTVSKQVAGYIENAKLHNELLNRTRQVEALSSISKLISGDTYLEEILRLIVSVTADSLGFKICSLMILDEKEEELSIVATQSLSADYRNKPPIRVRDSLSGRAVLEKRPVAIYDVRKEKEYQYPNLARQENLVSLLCVPLLVKNRCIGVLNSYTQEPHHFSDLEIQTLASVAHQSSIAIENTRLKKESVQSKEELETRKRIERAKGILMKEKHITEEQAFHEIRKTAMDRRISMKQVAEAILLSRDMRMTDI